MTMLELYNRWNREANTEYDRQPTHIRETITREAFKDNYVRDQWREHIKRQVSSRGLEKKAREQNKHEE